MGKLFFAVLAVISFLCLLNVLPAQAQLSCQPGYGQCPGGGCAPLGSVCTPNGRYAPAGSVVCSDGGYCEQGSICTTDGHCLKRSSPKVCSDGHHYCDGAFICGAGNQCIDAMSPRVCTDLHHYCEPGYECGSDNKCHPPMITTPPSGNAGNGSNDNSSSVTDAAYCINITAQGGDSNSYTVSNTCTFGVNIKLETMDFSPRQTSLDSYYIGATDSMLTYSYYNYTPIVISACGKGAIC
jgi:hypothetical protein